MYLELNNLSTSDEVALKLLQSKYIAPIIDFNKLDDVLSISFDTPKKSK
jgi:hypothetical protein